MTTGIVLDAAMIAERYAPRKERDVLRHPDSLALLALKPGQGIVWSPCEEWYPPPSTNCRRLIRLYQVAQRHHIKIHQYHTTDGAHVLVRDA